MFSYVTLGTNKHELAIVFYDAVMDALGHKRCSTDRKRGWVAWGRCHEGQDQLALWLCTPFNEESASVGNGVMVAFAASNRAQVDAFHQAGLGRGGVSAGEPGLRPIYGHDFYAAYLRDPDGNKICAVCRGPA